MTDMHTELFTPEQAAAMLHLTGEQLTRERYKKRIGYIKRCGKVLFTERHIKDYLDGGEVKPCGQGTSLNSAGNTGTSHGAKQGAVNGFLRGQQIARKRKQSLPGSSSSILPLSPSSQSRY